MGDVAARSFDLSCDNTIRGLSHLCFCPSPKNYQPTNTKIERIIMRSFSTTLLLTCPGLAAAQQVTDNINNKAGAGRPQQLGVTTSCPEVMVLAARETTAPPGFGSTTALVDLVLQAFPGVSAAQSIEYPAAGGNNTRA